jgi:hypothetical protein
MEFSEITTNINKVEKDIEIVEIKIEESYNYIFW